MTTRREFLAAIAVAAMPRLPQPERLQRRGPAQRVLVLGAGLAGLSTAYELQKQGHTVSVLEAQSRPGGRVRTLREAFAPGFYTEAGAESIPGVHDLTQYYARELGLTLLPNAVPGARSFYHVRGQRILPGDAAVWPLDLTKDERALGLAGLFRTFVDAATQQALASGFPQQPVRALGAWDPLTPGAWLHARGASPAAAELITLAIGGGGLGQLLETGRSLNDMSLVIVSIFLIFLVGIAVELVVFSPLERAVLHSRGLTGQTSTTGRRK